MKRQCVGCLVSLSVLTAFVPGCGSSNDGQPSLVNRDTADTLSSQHSKFDGPEPTISASTRFAAGNLAESQSQFARAIEQYQAALKLDPKHEQATYRLAVVYTMIKEYPQAIETWEKYVKLTKESATAYSNLGLANELAGRYDAAEQAYLKGIKKDENNASCHINYGLMLARHDKLGEARKQLSKVLPPGEVHYNLGSVYEARGMKNLARGEYATALKIDKDMLDAQKRLAALDQN